MIDFGSEQSYFEMIKYVPMPNRATNKISPTKSIKEQLILVSLFN